MRPPDRAGYFSAAAAITGQRTNRGAAMDDGADVYRVAKDMIEQLGPGAYSYLSEQAEIAALAGDKESAITWQDIARAVLEITKSQARKSQARVAGLALSLPLSFSLLLS